jgi:hypothetical protein
MTHAEYQDLAALDAVGALDENEIVALHQHLEECEECQEVERDYQECAAMLALGLDPVKPPDAVRSHILKNMIGSSNVVAFEPAEEPERNAVWWLGAAALFFIALFGWSELRLRAMREQVTELTAAANAAAENSRRLSETNRVLATQVRELSSPANKTISLVGQAVAPTAKAKVFMNERERMAVVFFQDLPANAPDKSYQLWVIRAGATSADPAGTFDAARDGSARVVMRDLPTGTEIKAIAVTLEPKGGLPAPSGEKYLVGTL